MTTPLHPRNTLLRALKSGQLRRVIWSSPDTSTVYLMDVSGEIPRGSRMPELMTKDAFVQFFKSGWSVVPNSLPAQIMSLPDSELSEVAVETRDRNWTVIESLVGSEESILRTLNKQTRPEAIRAAATAANVSVPRVYRLLMLYFWYGVGKFSLTPRFADRGTLKSGKETKAGPKRGRPNAVTKLEGATKYQGRNVNHHDLSKFTVALDEYWAGEHLSMSETYKAMKDKLYVASNQHLVGNSTKHKVLEHNIPTFHQFRYHAQLIIANLGLWEKRTGRKDWAQYVMSRTGNAADIALGPTDIYDMDVVELKCIAVTETNPPETIGNVKACLAVDRASRAIVGFHFFTSAESWEHYRTTLFRAFTSTQKHLEQLGFADLAEHAPDFAADAWCNSIYVDRGPARGREGFNAVVEGLRLERAIAPTSRGDMKAVVESINGKFQRQVARLPGGYNRVAGARNKERTKNAKVMARLTTKQISKFLAAAVAEHNEFHEVPELLTQRMLYDKVPPVPVAIFNWGKANLMGATSRDHVSEAELYLRLLPSFNVAVTRTGVRHKGYHFSSPELVKFRHQNLSTKRLKVDISYDSSDPSRRYWLMPNGVKNVLSISKQGKKRIEGIEGEDLEYFRTRELAEGIKRKSKKRSKAYISRVQEDILAEANARSFPSDHMPLLSPSDNKKIAIYQEALLSQAISRELLQPDGHDISNFAPQTQLSPKQTRPSATNHRRLNLSQKPSETSLPDVSAEPKQATEEVVVSKAKANFLKLFQPKKT